MRSWYAGTALLVLCGMLVAGCAKSSNSDRAANSANGPITDSASSGLKETGAVHGPLGNADHGMQIFNANCTSCHGQAGAGGGIGPALKGEKKRKNFTAAVTWIENPQPPMPKLYPAPLSEKDVDDVAAYVETL